MKKYINSITQKRNKAKNDFERTSINYSITLSMEKRWKI